MPCEQPNKRTPSENNVSNARDTCEHTYAHLQIGTYKHLDKQHT